MVVLTGIEAPPVSDDLIRWIDVRVPSTPNLPSPDLQTPPIDDVSSVCIIRDHDSHIYFLWRIHMNNPNVLEIVQFDSFQSFPTVGLRIKFPSELCPFASICRNEFCSSWRPPYMLYTMTVDGVIRLIYLDNVTNYRPGSVFAVNIDVEEINTHYFGVHGTITSIAATTGFVVIGKHNGWVGCFRLGSLESCSEGFLYELQEDPSNIVDHFLSKLSRRTVAPVKYLLCLEIHGRKLAFVLYEDGLLQLWDLLRCTRFLDKRLEGKFSGAKFMRLWAGETNSDSHVLPLAILHQPTTEDTISLYRCHICLTWSSGFYIEPSEMSISKEKDSIIDVKLSSNNILILERHGVVLHKLSDPTESGECNFFGLLEPLVAEQLFQDSEHAGNDPFWLINSVFPCAKEQIYNRVRVDSIFMRMVFLPGIFHKSVLGATFQDFKKQIADSELHALDHFGLKEEIRSIIEQEEASRGPGSFIYCWKNFCSRYFHFWCRENAPCGLLLHSSTGAVCLIRKSSVSLLRRLRDTEILSYGSIDEIREITRQCINSASDLEHEVLLEVFRCTSHLSQQLGKAAHAIFYDCSLHEPLICQEHIVRIILKVLADHNTTDMLLSLHELHRKAVTWETLVAVVLKYLGFLVSQKNEEGPDWDSVLGSIVNMLLLLNYMLKLNVQIHLSPHHVSKVQVELIQPLERIIKEWHQPLQLPPIEDFISEFSLLQTDSSTNHTPWDLGLRKRASRGTSSASR
ncbi:nucleoporin Nup120/160 [Tanacetum coccineum]|uniref:Nucleoporin Nup120/160 n=1 Tax=Tanacetum coccineum TaxID=301880 RepID=A0ABQ4ZJW4_9ASTR